jgi:hypothetical protein
MIAIATVFLISSVEVAVYDSRLATEMDPEPHQSY